MDDTSEDRQGSRADAPDVDRPDTAASPAADPAQFNSRIEKRLWLLRKGTDRAEARMCVKFARREFRVYVNGELLWSRNYRIEDAGQFDADAAAKHAEFTDAGWEQA